MDIENDKKSSQKLSKKNLENKRQFEDCMKETAKSGLQSFEYNGETYEIIRFGNCVQTLVDGRFLYRIALNDKNAGNKGADDLVNF